MASPIGDMVVRIVGDNSELDKSVDSSNKKLTSFANEAEKFGKKLSLFVTTPLIAAGVAAVKSSANMEMLQASFEVMLGSAEKATTLMADLKDLAARTPFEVNGLAEASKTLLQFGIQSDKIIPTLKQLGDISGGNSAKLQSLALVFGQIQSTGKLMGQDLLQLINAGFNPLQVISEQTGRSMSDLKDAMSKGAISASQVSKAFKIATSEGGRFFNGMEVASKTLSGLTSTLSDDVGALARSFVEDLMPIIKDVIKGLSSLAQYFTGLDKNTKQTILIVGAFVAALGPAILGVNSLVTAVTALNVTLLANPIVLATTALVALGATAALVANNIRNAREEKEALDKILAGGTTGDLRKDLEIISKEYENINKELILSREIYVEGNPELLAELEAIKKARTEIEMKLQGQRAGRDIIKETAAVSKELSETEIKQIKDRKDAQKEFETTLISTINAEKVGAISSIESKKQQLEANEKYRDSLLKAGYDLSTIGTLNESLGDKALQKSLITIEGLNKEIAAYDAVIASQQKNRDLQAEFYNQYKSELDLQLEAIYAKEAAYIAAGINEVDANNWAQEQITLATNNALMQQNEFDKKQKEERSKRERDLQNLQLLGVTTLIQGFKDIGAAAVNGELSWKSWGKLGLNVISKVLDALGETMIAQAAVDLGLGFFNPAAWAAIAPTLAAAAAAFAASGAVQALGVGLAEGGIAMPQPGGIQATIAEAGQPEAVIPLDRIGEVLNNINGSSEEINSLTQLTVNIDSEPIFSKIFDATRSKQILISANAVVET